MKLVPGRIGQTRSHNDGEVNIIDGRARGFRGVVGAALRVGVLDRRRYLRHRHDGEQARHVMSEMTGLTTTSYGMPSGECASRADEAYNLCSPARRH